MPFPWTLIGEGTDEQLLKYTRAAIAQITVTGQSYMAGSNRQLTRADLDTLWNQVKRLEERIAADAGGSTENVVRFKRD